MNDDFKIKSLYIMLPKTSACVKSYDGETKWTYFLIENDDLLKKYNDIWNKVSNSIKIELDCKPIYNREFLKTKIRSYGDEATVFHARKVPEAGPNYIHWSVVLIDSVLKKAENYFPRKQINA